MKTAPGASIWRAAIASRSSPRPRWLCRSPKDQARKCRSACARLRRRSPRRNSFSGSGPRSTPTMCPNRSTKRLRKWIAGVGIMAVAAVVAGAYDLITDSSGIYAVAWDTPTIPMRIMMPTPAAPLIDGTNYNTSVQAAMQAWNGVLGTVQFDGSIQPPGTYHNNNGVSEIVMDSKVDGEDFGSNTLAVTVSFADGNARKESDIAANT